jgi:hypothetical protein
MTWWAMRDLTKAEPSVPQTHLATHVCYVRFLLCAAGLLVIAGVSSIMPVLTLCN